MKATQTVDLLASYWTVSGQAIPHTGPEYSSFDFLDRVEALSHQGFTGMGIWHADLAHSLESHSLRDMKHILDDHGIRHVELEFLGNWFVDGSKREASDRLRRNLLEASQALGAHHIKVGDFFRTVTPMPRLIDEFGALCEEAKGFEATIGFELMPGAMIQTLDESIEMVSGTGQPNGGIILDLWHVVKLGIPYADAAALYPDWLVHVELNDGFLERPEGMDFVTKVTEHRNFCGREEFDIKPFVAAVWNAGYRGPWGVEVLRKAIRPWPLDEIVRTAYETTLAMFEGLEA
jgi:sugar phosphate isomerase/epimerase